MKQWKEKGMEILFLLAACVSILAVILICVFLFDGKNWSFQIPCRGEMETGQ